jgi:hypothetical protein
MLLPLSLYDLMHPLVGNTELACEFSLRNASSVSRANNDVTFFRGEVGIRRRGLRIEPVEDMRNGFCDQNQGWTDLWVVSPYGAFGAGHSPI